MSDVTGKIEWSSEFSQIAQEEIENELLALSLELEGRVKSHAPVGGSGLLRGSFVSEVQRTDFGVAIDVGTPLEYGAYVEFGTRPHWAPIDPLIRWVERKIQPHVLAVGVSFETGNAVPARKGTKVLRGDARTRAVLSLAYAIQRAIAKRGTHAQYMMRDSLDEMGLEYALVQTGSGQNYEVNVLSWLEGRQGLWERIALRMSGNSGQQA